MYKKILLLLIACGTLITIDAQEHTMELTLGQTIEHARRQSPDAQTAQHSFRSAYWNYKYYRANYLPALKLIKYRPHLKPDTEYSLDRWYTVRGNFCPAA